MRYLAAQNLAAVPEICADPPTDEDAAPAASRVEPFPAPAPRDAEDRSKDGPEIRRAMIQRRPFPPRRCLGSKQSPRRRTESPPARAGHSTAHVCQSCDILPKTAAITALRGSLPRCRHWLSLSDVTPVSDFREGRVPDAQAFDYRGCLTGHAKCCCRRGSPAFPAAASATGARQGADRQVSGR